MNYFWSTLTLTVSLHHQPPRVHNNRLREVHMVTQKEVKEITRDLSY